VIYRKTASRKAKGRKEAPIEPMAYHCLGTL